MHYFVVRETRARIRLPIGLRCWVYPVGYADRQNLSIGSSFITFLEQFTQLTLFPSGGAVFLWKMCSHSWSRVLVCRYRNEEG